MSKYVREVDSIDGLRETPVSDAAAAHVRTPTGKAGTFVPYDSDPIGTGDNGKDVVQAKGGGWWVRKGALNADPTPTAVQDGLIYAVDGNGDPVDGSGIVDPDDYATVEAAIDDAINAGNQLANGASANGGGRVVVSEDLLPYSVGVVGGSDSGKVNHDNSVRMVREEQRSDKIDAQAWGAAGNGPSGTDDLNAINAAASYADANNYREIHHPPGAYTVSEDPSFPGDTTPVGSAARYDGSDIQILSRPLGDHDRSLTYYIDPANGSDENKGLTTGSPLATIQEALNRLPRILRSSVKIDLTTAPSNNGVSTPYQYQEDVEVPPFLVSGLQEGANKGQVDIEGDTSTPSNVEIDSCRINVAMGKATVKVRGAKMISEVPNSNENVAFFVGGSGEASIRDIEYASGVSRGIIAYKADVDARGIDVTNLLDVGFFAKRKGRIYASDTKGTFDATSGNVDAVFFATQMGRIIHRNDNITINNGSRHDGDIGYNILWSDDNFTNIYKSFSDNFKEQSAIAIGMSSDQSVGSSTLADIEFDKTIHHNYSFDIRSGRTIKLYSPGPYRVTLNLRADVSGNLSSFEQVKLRIEFFTADGPVVSRRTFVQGSSNHWGLTCQGIVELPQLADGDTKHGPWQVQYKFSNNTSESITLKADDQSTRAEIAKIG